MNTLRVSPSAYIDALTLPELQVELVLAAARLVGTRVVPSSLGEGFVICRECAARSREGSPLLHTDACITGWAAHVLLAIGHAEADQALSNRTGKESFEQENRSSEPAQAAAQEKRPFVLQIAGELHALGERSSEQERVARNEGNNSAMDVSSGAKRAYFKAANLVGRAAQAGPTLPSQYHEPWTLSRDGEVLDADGHVMVDPQGCSLPEVGALLVMRRIVASVNHCQGVLTTELCRETERAAAGGAL